MHEQSMNHFFLNKKRQACMTVTDWMSRLEVNLEAIFRFCLLHFIYDIHTEGQSIVCITQPIKGS